MNKYPSNDYDANSPVFGRGLPISDSWQPSPAIRQQLASQGWNRYQLSQLRCDYIMECQRRDLRNADWDQGFLRYSEQQASTASAPATTSTTMTSTTMTNTTIANSSGDSGFLSQRHQAMTDDWRPNDEMVRLILATICPNIDYLNAQLISFTSHFHGQFNPNWDQQFKKWINNGWNVYGHKNSFAKQQDGRDFVAKHTDMSWTDGL